MFGQIPDFNDGLEFLRKMWGNAAGMPGMGAGLMPGLQAMTPPMSLEDVDKRIHDLKAVESWLQLNTNLLRTTIQGLEVQRATLVALKTFGNALSPEAMQTAMENVARAANAPAAARPRPAQPTPGAEGIDARDIADMAEMEATPDSSADAPPDEDPAERADDGDSAPRDEASATQGGASGGLPPQAGLWWDMVQRQFNQIASGAAAASLASLGNLGAFGAGAGGAGGAGNAGGTPSADAADSGPEAAEQAASRARGGSADTGVRNKRGAAGAPAREARPASAKAGVRAAAGRSGGNTAEQSHPQGRSPVRGGDSDASAPRPRRTRTAPKS